MSELYTGPKTHSTARTGLEVYKTDEENYKPYISSGVKNDNTSTASSEEDNSGFDYHKGDITEIYNYSYNIESTNNESDYKEMNNNGSLSLTEYDKDRLYKGVRLSLKKGWDNNDNRIKWDDLETLLTGFISGLTLSEDGVEVKIDGLTALLDEKYQYNFTNMKRSKILSEIISSAGLIPVIDTTGLDDDVTTYTSQSSSSSSNSTGIGSEDIDKLVSSIIGSETNELEKAKLIHEWLIKHLTYKGYSCSHCSTPEECLKKLKINCADTSRLTCAMMKSAGLNAFVVHGPNHFWTIILINGKEYASDATSSKRKFNTVWKNLNYYSKCGAEPSC